VYKFYIHQLKLTQQPSVHLTMKIANAARPLLINNEALRAGQEWKHS